MQIHVLTGYSEFLRPEIIAPDEFESILGSKIRAVSAYWLSRGSGDQYHDFLQEHPGDRRTAVIADAIHDGFGARFEPLLILDGLLADRPAVDEAEKRSQELVMAEILASGHFDRISLYALAFPEDVDPEGCLADHLESTSAEALERLDRVCATLSESVGPVSTSNQIVEVGPGMQCFDHLYNNVVSNALARSLEKRLRDVGWRADNKALAKTVFSFLSNWNDSGLYVEQPLGLANFQSMADILYGRLLQG